MVWVLISNQILKKSKAISNSKGLDSCFSVGPKLKLALTNTATFWSSNLLDLWVENDSEIPVEIRSFRSAFVGKEMNK